MPKPEAVPLRAVEATLLDVAVRVLDIEPPADADGFAIVVQLAPFGSVVDPLVQVPPLSNAKFVAFERVRLIAEDV
jgi:hypothetical protein